MHYALHIAIYFCLLWKIHDGENAAKTAVNPDVLTTFVKNVASVLSPTLLNDYQLIHLNRTSQNQSKNQRQSQPSTFGVTVKRDRASETLYKDRIARDDKIFPGDRFSTSSRVFQQNNIKPTIATYQQYKDKEENAQDFSSRRIVQFPQNDINVATLTHNSNSNDTEDSNDADVNTAGIHHFHRYRLPEYPKYKFAFPHDSLTGHYGTFGFNHHYNHYPQDYNRYPSLDNSYSAAVPSAEPTSDGENEEIESPPRETQDPLLSARLTYKPYTYNDGYVDPYYPPFYRQPGSIYPRNKPNDVDQPISPHDEQIENKSSGNPDEQQPNFRFYNYNLYRHHDPFYGHPSFHYPPHASNFSPEQTDGKENGRIDNNSTDQRFNFRDYGFNTRFPSHPSFYGRPQAFYPPQDTRMSDQNTSSEDGQLENNSTTVNNQPPYGHLPFQPLYGSFHLQGFPSLSYNLLPYDHFNNVFNVNLAPIKAIPFGGFYHEPFPYFLHSYPHRTFGDFYGVHRNTPKTLSRPESANKPDDERPETPSKIAENTDAELISESKLEKLIRASATNHYKTKVSGSLSIDKNISRKKQVVKRDVVTYTFESNN